MNARQLCDGVQWGWPGLLRGAGGEGDVAMRCALLLGFVKRVTKGKQNKKTNLCAHIFSLLFDLRVRHSLALLLRLVSEPIERVNPFVAVGRPLHRPLRALGGFVSRVE